MVNDSTCPDAKFSSERSESFSDLYKSQAFVNCLETASNRSPLFQHIGHCARRIARLNSGYSGESFRGRRREVRIFVWRLRLSQSRGGPVRRSWLQSDFEINYYYITSRVPSSHVRFYERDEHGSSARRAVEARKREKHRFKATDSLAGSDVLTVPVSEHLHARTIYYIDHRSIAYQPIKRFLLPLPARATAPKGYDFSANRSRFLPS